MTLLKVEGKTYVYNRNFLTIQQLVKNLSLTSGTVCTVQHCEQDHLPDEEYVIEQDGSPIRL